MGIAKSLSVLEEYKKAVEIDLAPRSTIPKHASRWVPSTGDSWKLNIDATFRGEVREGMEIFCVMDEDRDTLMAMCDVWHVNCVA